VAPRPPSGKVTRPPAHDMFDRDTASRSLGLEMLQAGDGEVVAGFRGRGRVIGPGRPA